MATAEELTHLWKAPFGEYFLQVIFKLNTGSIHWVYTIPVFSSSCIITAGSSFSRLRNGKLLSPIKRSDHLRHSWEGHDHTSLREPPASSWDWIFHPSIPDSLFASLECTDTFLFCSKAAFWQSKNTQHQISISSNKTILDFHHDVV